MHGNPLCFVSISAQQFYSPTGRNCPLFSDRSENKSKPDKEVRNSGKVLHGLDASPSTMAIQGEIQECRVRGVMEWTRRNPVNRARWRRAVSCHGDGSSKPLPDMAWTARRKGSWRRTRSDACLSGASASRRRGDAGGPACAPWLQRRRGGRALRDGKGNSPCRGGHERERRMASRTRHGEIGGDWEIGRMGS